MYEWPEMIYRLIEFNVSTEWFTELQERTPASTFVFALSHRRRLGQAKELIIALVSVDISSH